MIRYAFINLALVICLTCAWSANAKDLLVINPLGPRQIAIKNPKPTTMLDLKEGDEAALYNGDNGTVDHIRGPYTGSLANARKSRAEESGMLARALGAIYGLVERIVPGANRGEAVEKPQVVPAEVEVTDINLDTTLDQCYLGAPPRLWQFEAQGEGTIMLSQVGKASATIDMPAGTFIAIWPTKLALTHDQARYRVSYPDGIGNEHEFTLKSLDIDNPDVFTLDDLIAANCIFQAEVMLSKTLVIEDASQ